MKNLSNKVTRRIAAMLLVLLINSAVQATNYYVDPSSTATSANGSLLYPWKTISQANAGTTLLNPGDSVFFKRGQLYSGRLVIQRSGVAGKPIVYTNYGTGSLPEFNNAVSDIINISNRQFIVINGLKITDRSISATDHSVQAKISYAINISNSPNCTISNCDISLVGVGIAVYAGSDFTTITGNYLHNLRMVRNTPTSVNPDDDYGANPMVIGSSNNKILNNRFEECWASSYYYGFDGGAVEFFGSTMNNNQVMYNTAINCNGFLEVGSSTGGIAENNLIAYNKIINCGIIGVYQNGSTFTVSIKNLQYYNNVVIETMKQYTKPSVLFWMAGTGNPGLVVLKNNIFWLSSGVNVAGSKFNSGQMIHTNNIYRMTSGIPAITLNNTEILGTDFALFNSTSGDPASWDLSTLASSRAIDFGTPVGLSTDYSGKAIQGNPDAGIYEATSIVVEKPAPLVISAVSGQIKCFGDSSSVTISATGGKQPYTGTGIFRVKAGTHRFYVSDANGNKDSISVNLIQPTLLSANLTAGSITTTGGTTTVSIAASGGTSPYLYAVNGGLYQTNPLFSNLSAGNYSFNTKDNNGCITLKSVILAESTETYLNPRYRVTIWPNPTTNYFKLKLSKIHGPYTVYITVYNSSGKLVYATQGDVYTQYSFGNSFNKGSYLVKIRIGTGIKSYTVVKI
jgi:parallel beta-helix repeat protein